MQTFSFCGRVTSNGLAFYAMNSTNFLPTRCISYFTKLFPYFTFSLPFLHQNIFTTFQFHFALVNIHDKDYIVLYCNFKNNKTLKTLHFNSYFFFHLFHFEIPEVREQTDSKLNSLCWLSWLVMYCATQATGVK
jgi:hypothetical protein